MTTRQKSYRIPVAARPAGVVLCAFLALSLSAEALPLPPDSARTAEDVEELGSETLAVGPWVDGAMQVIRAEGAVTRTAWRIDDTTATTMEILKPLRDGLAAEGYEVLYECETDGCGGFDFRYGLHILPEPDMHVDLGDFRYILAVKTEAGESDHIALVVSRSARAGFVQMTRVDPSPPEPEPVLSTKSPDLGLTAPAGTEEAAVAAAPAPAPAPGSGAAPVMETPSDASGLSARLAGEGRVVLDDLRFATGSSDLGDGTYPSLAALAAYLAEHPEHRVVLVGHTDAEGDLQSNIALSRKRAASVRERLISAYKVPAAQLDAEGAGFLAPRASNLTDEGRTENRRVEAMLASTR